MIELVKDEAWAETQVSLTPESVFQAVILYWFSLWNNFTHPHVRMEEDLII